MIYHKIQHFKSLASTQDKAKELAKRGLSNVVIVADFQTKGRGRFNRKWHSAKEGLWMSILLKPNNIENISYLTFAAAIAVVDSIKKIANLNTSIKWPNDVHYLKKKLCGILTEGIFGKDNYVVVGIGLNVNQIKFPEEIRDTATSLIIIKNKEYSLTKLTKNIADKFFHLYTNYYNKHKLVTILKLWKKHCSTLNKYVIVTTKTKKIRGKAINVDGDCNLLIKLKNGNVMKITEGDINVKYYPNHYLPKYLKKTQFNPI
ncbi:MAG: biotin--[acetyl-CoA-carboxylase] ligase [Nanoarchaeota archaeon]